MNWPQITWIVLMAAGLLISANSHGKPKTGTHNFWAVLTSAVIQFALVYCGGFFK